MDTKHTVGSFSIDMNGTVEGPAEYMTCPGGFAVVKEQMESGRSVVFNYGGSILVAVQTHYAGWRGQRELALRSEAARASQAKFLESVRGVKW